MREPRTWFAAGVVVAGLLVWQLRLYVANALAPGLGPPGDFIALWSFGRFALTQPLAGIYDPAALHAFQVSLGAAATIHAPYPYPPVYALLLAPFALLPPLVAYVVWIGGTLALYVAVMRRLEGYWAAVAVALLPSTAVAVVAGQNGLLSAALVLGGLRWAPARPVLGGVLLGLLAYKPQLGVLVPVALVAGGHWRAMTVAASVVAGLVAAVGVAFGFGIWGVWLGSLGEHYDAYSAPIDLDRIMVTVHAAVLILGGSARLALAVQAASAVAVVVLVWRRARGRNWPMAVSAVQVGTFLATPYALAYDLPMMGSALAGLVLMLWRQGAVLATWELLVCVAAAAVPVVLADPDPRFPVAVAVLAPLFAVMLRRA